MSILRRAALAASLGWLGAGSAWAASLQIEVQGVRDARGTIRIGLCTRSEFLGPRCALNAVVPARPGTVSARIRQVPPGVYAVAAFQDLDGSGKLKRSLLGLPEEDIGFSRNPSLRYGPPSFARSAITIGSKDGHIALSLRHSG